VDAAEPKVPPGRDPGGVAVALIEAGLDYRRSEFAARLARDGEGDLIGWDLVDNDARPFSAAEADGRLASIVLAEGQSARLIVVRVAPGRHDQIAAGLRFSAGTPARVALLASDPGVPVQLGDLIAAARQLPGMLLIVPARHVAAGPPGFTRANDGDRSGLLVVAGAGQPPSADVASTLVARPGTPVEVAVAAGRHPDDIAAARVAGLAARVLAVEPGLTPGLLAGRILDLAIPQQGGPPLLVEIARIRWLE
jgi:hypothetical protein